MISLLYYFPYLALFSLFFSFLPFYFITWGFSLLFSILNYLFILYSFFLYFFTVQVFSLLFSRLYNFSPLLFLLFLLLNCLSHLSFPTLLPLFCSLSLFYLTNFNTSSFLSTLQSLLFYLSSLLFFCFTIITICLLSFIYFTILLLFFFYFTIFTYHTYSDLTLPDLAYYILT